MARLEIELQRMQEGESRSAKSNKFQFSSDSFKDDALDDEKCHQKCNERLKSSLDMVKVHQGFGSIGVPPVVDATDLMLFCRYDSEHDKCLRECGFTVQFNMRDFVCKQHYAEMESLLSCYTKAAPALQRQCGAQRCGPYDGLTQTDKSLIGSLRTQMSRFSVRHNVHPGGAARELQQQTRRRTRAQIPSQLHSRTGHLLAKTTPTGRRSSSAKTLTRLWRSRQSY
ncbi:unnamed protein product [Anisakis simplex]|uniref:Chondroitin proteoglycan 4 domain-containing protein n=1 Tax=Anisakis simplex TaxID=6269 RepID=A0A3P6NN26_ANISI|nr:unnamed protein product [Anisakis simplex]